MKSPDQVAGDIRRRLERTWAAALADPAVGTWPHRFPVGAISAEDLAGPFAELAEQIQSWYRWVREQHVAGVDIKLHTATRRVEGTTQTVPTHVSVPTIEAAAGVASGHWPQRLAAQRDRCEQIRAQFPALSAESVARTLRDTSGYSVVDFQLVCEAATWFQSHSAAGLTPRQVPIPGLHAKWLNTSQHLVQRLAGVDSLNLLVSHPPRVHLTYLDPDHLAGGGRRYDVATVGDVMTPAYRPRLILISENKDTAVCFPPVAGGIAIEGGGDAGPTAISQIEWVRACPVVRYWGDIDAEGFEIVNAYRAAGLVLDTLLMDRVTYEQYLQFGSYTDRRGNPLCRRPRHPLPHLTATEADIYALLTDPASTGPPRLEQERIPLADAVAALVK